MLKLFSSKIKICSPISLRFIYSIIYSILYYYFFLNSNVLFCKSSISVSLVVIHYTSNIHFYFSGFNCRDKSFSFFTKKKISCYIRNMGGRYIYCTRTIRIAIQNWQDAFFICQEILGSARL